MEITREDVASAVKETVEEMLSEQAQKEQDMLARLQSLLGETVWYHWTKNSSEVLRIPAVVCSGRIMNEEIHLDMVAFTCGMSSSTLNAMNKPEGAKAGRWQLRR